MTRRFRLSLPDCPPLDLLDISDRGAALRWLAARAQTQHAPIGFPMHDVRLDPQALCISVGPHRHAGAAVRLDGFCLNCPPIAGSTWRWAPAYIHQDNLLPWAGKTYVGGPEICMLPLRGRRVLPDGTPWVEAEALRITCLAVAGLLPVAA